MQVQEGNPREQKLGTTNTKLKVSLLFNLKKYYCRNNIQ